MFADPPCSAAMCGMTGIQRTRDTALLSTAGRLFLRSFLRLLKVLSKIRNPDSSTWWSPVRPRERATANGTAIPASPPPPEPVGGEVVVKVPDKRRIPGLFSGGDDPPRPLRYHDLEPGTFPRFTGLTDGDTGNG